MGGFLDFARQLDSAEEERMDKALSFREWLALTGQSWKKARVDDARLAIGAAKYLTPLSLIPAALGQRNPIDTGREQFEESIGKPADAEYERALESYHENTDEHPITLAAGRGAASVLGTLTGPEEIIPGGVIAGMAGIAKKGVQAAVPIVADTVKAAKAVLTKAPTTQLYRVKKSGEIVEATKDITLNPGEALVEVDRRTGTWLIEKGKVPAKHSDALFALAEEGVTPAPRILVQDATPDEFGQVRLLDAVDRETGAILGEVEIYAEPVGGFTVNKFRFAEDIEGATAKADIAEALYKEAGAITGGPLISRPKGAGITGKIEKRVLGPNPELRYLAPPIPEKLEDPVTGLAGSSAKMKRWLQANFYQQGVGVPISKKFSDKAIQKFFRKAFPDALEQSASSQRAMMFEFQNTRQSLDRAVRTSAKAMDIPTAELRREINELRKYGEENEFLQEALASYPPELQEAIAGTDNFIDSMTQLFINEGVVKTAEDVTKLKANIGRYLHTSYEAYDDPKFAAKLMETTSYERAETVDLMYAFLREKMPDATNEEVLGKLYTFLPKTGDFPAPSTVVQRMSLDELLSTKMVPEEVQDLMGMYEDININAEKTALVMVQDLALERMFRGLAVEGEKLGVFRRVPVANSRTAFATELTGKVGDLRGLYTSDDIKELIDTVHRETRMGGFAWLSGLVKFGKVGFSHPTQLRNWESGAVMSMNRGLFLTPDLVSLAKDFGKTTQVQAGLVFKMSPRTLKTLGVNDVDELAGDIASALDHGVIGRGAMSSEFASYVQAMKRGTMDPLKAGKAALSEGVITRLYRAGDDFWKYVNWKAQIRSLDWAYEGKVPTEQIKLEAAEDIANTMQTYDRAPRAAQLLSRNPFWSPFVTFQAEMPRNIVNNLTLAFHEFGKAAEHPRFAVLGMRRIAGTLTALSTTAAFEMYSAHKQKLDEERQEAIRNLLFPEYAKNSRVVITSYDEDEVTFLDTQYVNPYSLVDRITVGLTRPGSMQERLIRILGELQGTFFSPEIALKGVAESVMGRYISPSGFSTYGDVRGNEPIKNTVYHLWRSLGPGSPLALEKLLRSFDSKMLPNTDPRFEGVTYDTRAEAYSQFGPRFQTRKITDSFGDKASWYTNEIRSTSAYFNRDEREADPNAIQKAEQRWQPAYIRMQTYVENMRQLGKSDSIIRGVMKEKKISGKVIDALVSGEYMSYAAYKELNKGQVIFGARSTSEEAAIMDAIYQQSITKFLEKQ